MSGKPPPPPRLFCIFAREAPIAAVFRRGPSKQVQVVKWNTDDDSLEPGQWLKGRVYERRGDLSPNGRLLIYFGGDQRYLKGPGTWTAISKLPYLTALAFFPKGDAWGGGGLFIDNRKVGLNGPHDREAQRVAEHCPLKIGQLDLFMGEDEPIQITRLQRDGWKKHQDMIAHIAELPPPRGTESWWNAGACPTPQQIEEMFNRTDTIEEIMEDLKNPAYAEFSKGYTTGQKCVLSREVGGFVLGWQEWLEGWNRIRKFTLRTPAGAIMELPETQWADFDHRGRICFEHKGGIHAIEPRAPEFAPKQLFNLSDSRFEPIPPPEWATKW